MASGVQQSRLLVDQGVMQDASGLTVWCGFECCHVHSVHSRAILFLFPHCSRLRVVPSLFAVLSYPLHRPSNEVKSKLYLKLLLLFQIPPGWSLTVGWLEDHAGFPVVEDLQRFPGTLNTWELLNTFVSVISIEQ